MIYTAEAEDGRLITRRVSFNLPEGIPETVVLKECLAESEWELPKGAKLISIIFQNRKTFETNPV